jgi:Ca2+-binding EF-hand superfamily protein
MLRLLSIATILLATPSALGFVATPPPRPRRAFSVVTEPITTTFYRESLLNVASSSTDDDVDANVIQKIRKDADTIFSVIDTNGDGSISQEEMTVHMTKAGYTEAAVENIFKKLDVNSDGGISKAEFRSGLVRFAALRSAPGLGAYNSGFVAEIAQDSDHLFKTVDTDRSGSISFKELQEHMRRTTEYSDAAIANIFIMLDENTDGEVSSEELRDAFVRSSALRQALGEGPNYK